MGGTKRDNSSGECIDDLPITRRDKIIQSFP